MLLSIIVLSYNTKDLTVNCLKSIIALYSKELEKNDVEIIVVDNASTDDSVLSIKKQVLISGKNLHIAENKNNFGFAMGCNIGARETKGKYLLFLNSDTEAQDWGFLKMTKFLDEHSEVAILGGKLYNPDGSPQPSTGKFYNLLNLFVMLLGLERLSFLRSSPNSIKKVDWVSGACMMVRRSVFEKIKGFDEHFFMYMEDVELCFNAKKLGFFTYFYPNLSLIHKGLGSSNRKFAMKNIYRGVLYFYRKHKSSFEYNLAKFLLRAKAMTAILIGNLTGNEYLKKTYKEALKF